MAKFSIRQNQKFWNEYAKKVSNNPFGAHTDKHVVELENLFIISKLKKKKDFKLIGYWLWKWSKNTNFFKICR